MAREKKTKEPSPELVETGSPTHCPRHYSQPLDLQVFGRRRLLRCPDRACDYTVLEATP